MSVLRDCVAEVAPELSGVERPLVLATFVVWLASIVLPRRPEASSLSPQELQVLAVLDQLAIAQLALEQQQNPDFFERCAWLHEAYALLCEEFKMLDGIAQAWLDRQQVAMARLTPPATAPESATGEANVRHPIRDRLSNPIQIREE